MTHRSVAVAPRRCHSFGHCCLRTVHYQIDDASLTSARRPCGDREIGVDKSYTEVLTDSDGARHGRELGGLLRTRSDVLKARNAARARLRWIANQAAQRGQHGKAARIREHNLGTVKKHRQEARWQRRVRDVTYRAVHRVVDKATVIVAEDLTRPFTGRKKLGRNIGLYTPHTRVKQIIQERADRHRSRLPDQDSNTARDCRCGERMIPTNGQQ